MIVTCQECQTQFRLDDAKVPENGIRVRCSRCKCAFFVESPHKPAPDQGEDIAREALVAEPPPEVAAAPDPSPASASAPEAGPSEEESDWQFNDEVDPVLGEGGPADELAAARDAVDDLLGGALAGPVDPVTGSEASNEASDSGFDLVSDDFAEEDEDSGFDTHDPVFAEDPGSEFDADDPEEDDLDDDPNAVTIDRGVFTASQVEEAADPGLDLEAGPDLDLDLDLESDSEPDAAADSDDEPLLQYPDEASPVEAEADDAPKDPFGEADEELGSPADWDFFEEGDAPPAAARDAFDAGALSEADAALDFAGPDAVISHPLVAEQEVDVSVGDAWFTRLRGLLGWALVTGLCLYATAVVLFPGAARFAPKAAPIQVAGLEMVRVEGRWVENAVAGPVYVVSGAFHSTGGARPADGSVLRVRMLDASGRQVASETAAVGAPIQTVRLREANPRDLRAGQERSAPSILGDPLARRKRRPFMALLGDVPPNAVAFDFQVASAATPEPLLDAAPALDSLAAETLAGEGREAAADAAPVGVERVEARRP